MTAPVPRPGIMDIAPYVGGESSLAGARRIVKLSSNEGALGPSAKAMAAYAAQVDKLHRYPDGNASALRAALAERWAVDPARIVCGAGSDEILGLLCRAYAGPGDEVIHTAHGFLMYAIAAKSCGATPVSVPENNLTADVDAILRAVTPRTRIVFLANPNNPTGTYLPTATLRRLRAGLRDDILLILDAAYAEFVTEKDYSAGIELVHEYENVVMTRTFSKVFALGGLRLGWGYCPLAIADVLHRSRNPFNVASPALAAGVAALEDVEHMERCLRQNQQGLAWVQQEAKNLGLEVTESVCNFSLMRFKSAEAAAQADAFLRENGIIVRAMKGYGLPERLRVTIGNDEENQIVMATLKDFLHR